MIYVGISGWSYPRWRGVFYPQGLRTTQELAFAAERFSSVEVNGTFYSLKRPPAFAAWYDQTPPGFVFAIKGSRFITHMKKLRDVETPLANFFAQGVLSLGEKLGPVLWQLPPQLAYDEARMEAFLRMLPRDTDEASRLARRHDARLTGRSVLRPRAATEIRHAVEVRHPSFLGGPFLQQLKEHHVALVAADAAARFPYAEEVTAPFVYVRLHGSSELYVSGYTPDELQEWASKVCAWSRGDAPEGVARRRVPERQRDAYVYFDNDALVHAPFDALSLDQRIRAQLDVATRARPVARAARGRP